MIKAFFRLPFWEGAFRPFFFFGALYSFLSLSLWGLFFTGRFPLEGFFAHSFLAQGITFHAHEMIFGFTMSIVAGFLLTAVPKWTFTPPVHGARLGILVGLWLLGRLVMVFRLGLPFWAGVVAESLFIPAVGLALCLPLLRTRNNHNFIFIGLFAVLWACDLWFLLTQDSRALYVALMIVIIKVSLVGGRIIPFFTTNALRRAGVEVQQVPQLRLDMAAMAVLILLSLFFALDIRGPLLSFLAAAATVIHLLRLRRYFLTKVWKDPLLWVLHSGYLWLIFGLFSLIFVGFGAADLTLVLHIFTVGVIGVFTLGMVSRVALGHTGRPFVAPKAMVFAFYLMEAAAVMRVFGVWVFPQGYTLWIIGSAFLWSCSFLIYLVVYTPILWGPEKGSRPIL